MSPAKLPMGTYTIALTVLPAFAKKAVGCAGSGTNVPGVPPATSRTSYMLRPRPVLRCRRLIAPSMRVGEKTRPPSDPERSGIWKADCDPPGKVGRSAR
jgi:hypothetical protein